MTTQTETAFPGHESMVKELVNEHKKIKAEPLLLALYYAPDRSPEDIFLFEVIENFGGDFDEEEKDLFEVTYGSTSGFPMQAGQQLHLIIASPEELEVAVNQGWPAAKELKNAFLAGKAKVLFENQDKGKQILRLIHA
jgi:hypothetical protein